MAVERSSDHQAKDVDRRLRMPAPPGALKYACGACRQIGEIGLSHGLGRQVRMDIDRHVEVDSRSQDTVIAWVVEEVAIGRAVDERTAEAELLHGAGKLGGGRVRLLHRQRGETRETIGTT